jgi:hypothetical protein
MSKKNGSRFDTLFSEAGASRTDLSKDEAEDVLELGAKTPSSKRTTKSTDPDYTRATIYLPKEMHRQIKVAAIVEEREMSDIVAEAISQYFQTSRHLNV